MKIARSLICVVLAFDRHLAKWFKQDARKLLNNLKLFFFRSSVNFF